MKIFHLQRGARLKAAFPTSYAMVSNSVHLAIRVQLNSGKIPLYQRKDFNRAISKAKDLPLSQRPPALRAHAPERGSRRFK